MALSPSRLSAAVRAGLLANADTLAQDNDSLTAVCDAIAVAVIAEITANGVVAVPATGLVAPGGMSPAPVTGAATGTIS